MIDIFLIMDLKLYYQNVIVINCSWSPLIHATFIKTCNQYQLK